eukprot:s1276_g12.t1
MNRIGAGGGGGGGAVAAGGGGGGGGGITMEEVGKHNSKTDCWVVVDGQVLDVTSFLSEHPGGELAILTFAGKDATEEFNMTLGRWIHPPDVIGKYAPDSIIGKVGSGAPAPAAEAAAGGGLGAPLLDKSGHKARDWSRHEKTLGLFLFFLALVFPDFVFEVFCEQACPRPTSPRRLVYVGSTIECAAPQQPRNRELRMKGEGRIPGWIGAVFYMVLGFMKEILFTIVPQSNVTITGDRVGLTRSAMFLFIFIIIHAVGNLHVFLGPDDFNGYGYFYVRLYWTGFGFQANIVEEYILLAALLHVFVALKRTSGSVVQGTWDISMNYSVASGKLNLAFSGVTLLTFMMIHLYQFRFGDTEPWKLCPPPYLLNLPRGWQRARADRVATLLQLRLNLFWVDTPGCQAVYVRDIYRMEFEIFQSLGWVLFYLAAVIIFSTHMCLGWQKVVPAPALEIPKKYHSRAIHMGYVFTFFIALIYASFPLYTHLFAMTVDTVTFHASHALFKWTFCRPFSSVAGELPQVLEAMAISMAEVAKHNSKTDCWVVVAGDVLNVTSFLSEHPGGELAIITFAGKDATEEFNMIHPPDVISKYAPDSIVGKLGAGGAAPAAPAAPAPAPVAAAPAASAAAPLLDHHGKNWSKSEQNREMRMKGEGPLAAHWS